jgi:hypothetical protein
MNPTFNKSYQTNIIQYGLYPWHFQNLNLLKLSIHIKNSYTYIHIYIGLVACPPLTLIEVSRGSKPSKSAISKIRGGLESIIQKKACNLFLHPCY